VVYSTSAPKPLTFDFELPASAGPSSRASTSDPLFSSRTRLRSARSRNIERVQSRSQNDVFASPVADASKFLDMLGRVSVCVDENSRKRMKVLGGRAQGSKKPLIKGKERLCATAGSTRSMDEFGDHTNFIRDAYETRVHYSSLPTIILESQSKDPSLSQRQPTSTIQAEYKKNDVHTHNTDTAAVDASAPAPGNDGIKPPVVSSRPQNGTQHFPPRATLRTRHSQKRIELPSPTPLRSSAPLPLRPVPAPAPTPAHVPAHKPKSSGTSESALPKSTPAPLSHQSQYPHLVPVPTPPPPAANDALLLKKGASASAAQAVPTVPMADSLTRHGRSTSASTSAAVAALPPPSQTHGFKRALGMTRTVLRSSSSSSSSSSSKPTSHSSAAKKPFRPPLARPAAPGPGPSPTPQTSYASATKPPQIPLTTSSRSHDSQRQQQQRRRQEDGSKKGPGSDPDSSFDISFDFDPEALEAAMKQYD
jgi:hypothetical protein